MGGGEMFKIVGYSMLETNDVCLLLWFTVTGRLAPQLTLGVSDCDHMESLFDV